MNIVGVGTGKWLQNAGGIGTYIPGVVLIVLGAVFAVRRHVRRRIRSRAQNIVPDLGTSPG